MPSSFLCGVVNERISFLFMTDIRTRVCASQIVLIYLFLDRYLHYFHILVTVTKAVIHVDM